MIGFVRVWTLFSVSCLFFSSLLIFVDVHLVTYSRYSCVIRDICHLFSGYSLSNSLRPFLSVFLIILVTAVVVLLSWQKFAFLIPIDFYLFNPNKAHYFIPSYFVRGHTCPSEPGFPISVCNAHSTCFLQVSPVGSDRGSDLHRGLEEMPKIGKRSEAERSWWAG